MSLVGVKGRPNGPAGVSGINGPVVVFINYNKEIT
jgi:hypothetical protein